MPTPFEIDPSAIPVFSSNAVNVTPGNAYDQYDLDENGNVTLRQDSPVPDVALQPPAAPQLPVNPDEVMATALGQKVPPSAPLASASASQGQSVSASRNGFSPGMFDVVDAKSRKGLGRDLAEANNRAAKYEDALTDGLDEITATKKAATENVARLEADKMDTEAQLGQEMAAAERQMALDNQTEYAQIQNKTAAYMADYEKSVVDLANSTPNPGRAYSNMSATGRAGIAMTAFVQDFLGAKGIKTSGLEHIHKAVDMDIQAQRDAYMAKKDLVAGQLNIYQLHKEQGDSDYMASVKTRATLMEAAKMEATSKLAAMNSPIATARIPLLQAAIDEQQMKYRADAARDAMKTYETLAGQAVQVNGQRLSAAMEGRRLALEERKFKAAQDAAAGPKPINEATVVRTPSGKVVGRIVDEKLYKEVSDKVAVFSNFQDKLADYSKFVQENGKTYGGPGNKLFDDALKLKRDALRIDLAYSFATMNGNRVPTDPDYKNAERVMTSPTFTTGLLGGQDPTEAAVQALGEVGSRSVREYMGYLNQHMLPVDDATAQALQGAPREDAIGKARAYETKFGMDSRGDTTNGGTKTEVDKAIGIVDSMGKKNSAPTDISEEDNAPLYQRAVDFEKSGGEILDMYFDQGGDDHYTVPKWFTGMERLATVATDPGTSEAERNRAIDALVNMTHPDSITGEPNEQQKQQSLAAMFYLQELSKTPNSINYGK